VHGIVLRGQHGACAVATALLRELSCLCCPADNKTKNPFIKDDFVAISAMHIQPDRSSSAAFTSEAVNADEAAADGTAAAAAAEEPAAKRQRTAEGSSNNAASQATSWLGPRMSALAPDAVCYMCQLASIPGKFNPQKAAALGVPRGPVSMREKK
jgi:hypothetical protein